MRVLHIITGLGVGGAEQQLRLLLRHLPSHGVDSEVIALANSGPVADGIRADGTPVTCLSMNGNRDFKALPKLVALIRRGQYDVVHTHLYRACVYGRIAARLAGVRAVVATEHSLGDVYIEGRRLTVGVRALYLATERLGATTVAVSPTVADRLQRWGVPAPRIEVVPNGIDATAFRYSPETRRVVRAQLGLPEGAFTVGGVGRLVRGKRFDELVRAVAQLPEVHLLLIGGGPEREALETLVARLGMRDRVLLLGERAAFPTTSRGSGPAAHGTSPGPAAMASGTGGVGAMNRPGARPQGGLPAGAPGAALPSAHHEVTPPSSDDHSHGPDLPGLLSAMDVLVSPCPEETFGLAVIEGLAAGLPVLHVACPAIDDLLADAAPGARRITGGADGIADALRRLRTEGTGRLTVPPAVHHYDIARSAERLGTVYEHVAARPIRRTAEVSAV
ncbi:glycosyltransferase [Streptomyces sp. NPDC001978]|uniref:glycosyltransferase n=1 Tax=Streptomyces sp. NPDC001978 TaxID=3364627 RepID=UPI0036947779